MYDGEQHLATVRSAHGQPHCPLDDDVKGLAYVALREKDLTSVHGFNGRDGSAGVGLFDTQVGNTGLGVESAQPGKNASTSNLAAPTPGSGTRR